MAISACAKPETAAATASRDRPKAMRRLDGRKSPRRAGASGIVGISVVQATECGASDRRSAANRLDKLAYASAAAEARTGAAGTAARSERHILLVQQHAGLHNHELPLSAGRPSRVPLVRPSLR
jgi:hypothetical protein